jgi:hypothetical protein
MIMDMKLSKLMGMNVFFYLMKKAEDGLVLILIGKMSKLLLGIKMISLQDG